MEHAGLRRHHRFVDAAQQDDGTISLRMSQAEAMVLHEVIASAEWSNELDAIELRQPVERKVVSDVQQALQRLIPALGTDAYGTRVQEAYTAIDCGPW